MMDQKRNCLIDDTNINKMNTKTNYISKNEFYKDGTLLIQVGVLW